MVIRAVLKGLSAFMLFVCISCFLAVSFLTPSTIFNCGSGLYSFYLYSTSSNAQIVTVDYAAAKKQAKSLKDVKGESVFLDFGLNGKADCLNIIDNEVKNKNARLVFCEKGEWGDCYYYYTERIADFCLINGERVNIHVVISQNSASIGSPLLFGSF